MVVMETSLKDLCSSCDTHAAHALIDRLTKLRCGIFSCVRKFLPFHKREATSVTSCYLSWQCDLFCGCGVRSAL